MKVRIPSAELLAAAPHFAALAALECAVAIAARALRAAYPDADRAFQPREPAELTTARTLVDECDAMLMILDDHRIQVTAHLRATGLQPDWPF